MSDDPKRLADDPGSPLGELLREARHDGPDDDAIERLLASVSRATAGAPTNTLVSKGALGWALAGATLLAGVTAVVTMRVGSPDTTSELDAGAEDAGAEDAGAEDAGAEDAGAEDAGAEDAQPTVAGSLPRRLREPSPRAEPSPPIDEAALVRRAIQALPGSPAVALALTAELARAPAPRFAEERERIAIEALARLGRTSDARGRLERFRARWPGSVHLQLLEARLAP